MEEIMALVIAIDVILTMQILIMVLIMGTSTMEEIMALVITLDVLLTMRHLIARIPRTTAGRMEGAITNLHSAGERHRDTEMRPPLRTGWEDQVHSALNDEGRRN